MLIPYTNTKFENVSSRDFYARSKELSDCKFNGCLTIAFPDHESVIFYEDGIPITGMQEYNRWVSLSDDMIEPIENKALNSDGKMTAFETPPGFLHIFLHKRVESSVNSELGPFLSIRAMARNFEDDHSTCFIKVRDQQSHGYVFVNFGKQVGAVFESPMGKSYDDNAMKEMDQLKDKAKVSVYFLQFSTEYIKAPSPAIEGPEALAKAPEAPRLAESMPSAGHKLNPVESDKSITYVLKQPSVAAATPQPAHTKLIVVMSDDKFVGLLHRSKLRTLEALNEESVAWVDKKTIKSLNIRADQKAHLVLSGGKEYPVTVREVEITPEESKFIILPHKLRKRLSINKGAMVSLKA